MRIGILGYGVEGKAMAEYLLSHGETDVTVCDRNLDVELDGVSARLGADYLKGLSDFDVVYRSPGVKLFDVEDAIQESASGGVHAATKISSMTKFFFEKCPCPIIGVTGTKGKGTTSTLIYEILKAAGRDAFLGGNIGRPPVEFLDELRNSSVVVLELSSFQLQDLDRSPHVAVVLNVTSEHMDYHSSVQEYRDAKANIARFQGNGDFLVLNGAYPYSAAMFGSNDFRGKKVLVNTKGSDSKSDYLVREDGMITARNREILSMDDVGLLGKHNLENILPAIAVAEIMNVPVDQYCDVIRKFRGLPHRLEFAGETASGVRFYNDSFSTTPETSIAGFMAFESGKSANPVFLLAGGSEKFSDFSEWAREVCAARHVQRIFLMGPSGDRMEQELLKAGCDAARFEKVANLKEGFAKAFAMAKAAALQEGRGTILLSPGAASFNEFSNYKERGEIFRTMVKEVLSSAPV